MVFFKKITLFIQVFIDMARLINDLRLFLKSNNIQNNKINENNKNYSLHSISNIATISKQQPKIEKINKPKHLSLKFDNVYVCKASYLQLLSQNTRNYSVKSSKSFHQTPKNKENNHFFPKNTRSNSITGIVVSPKTIISKNKGKENLNIKIKKQLNSNLLPLAKDILRDYTEKDLKIQIENIVKQGKQMHKTYND